MKLSVIAIVSSLAALAFGSTVPVVRDLDLDTPELDTTADSEAQSSADSAFESRSDNFSCYHRGTKANRHDIEASVREFCSQYKGRTLHRGDHLGVRYAVPNTAAKTRFGKTLLLSIDSKCTFKLGDHCWHNMNVLMNHCDPGAEQQGGLLINNCAQYRLDPGTPGNDY